MGFNNSLNHKSKIFKSMLVNRKEADVSFFKYLHKENLTFIMPIKDEHENAALHTSE